MSAEQLKNAGVTVYKTCPVCGEPTECGIAWSGFRAPCMCRCERERRDAERKRLETAQTRARIDQLRGGIRDGKLRECTFERDDGKSEKMEIARRYVERWDEMYEANIGLYLYGGVGSGKTYAAACIANALIDQGVTVLMTTVARLVDKMQGAGWGDRMEYLDSLKKYKLLVLDDFGTECQNKYMQECAYNIIDARYRQEKPLIVTSNLGWKDLQEGDAPRIASRLDEMCAHVLFPGADRRQANGKSKRAVARAALLGGTV